MKLADIRDLKSLVRKNIRVRVPSPALFSNLMIIGFVLLVIADLSIWIWLGFHGFLGPTR